MQALQRSGKLREHIFLTTKIHPQDLGYEPTKAAFQTSLTAFSTTYLDLVLLHYAGCFGNLCSSEPEGTWQESWRALEELVRQGSILAIGTLSFQVPLPELLSKRAACSYYHTYAESKSHGLPSSLLLVLLCMS